MGGSFDFSVIGRSLGYLFLDGLPFTLMLTALASILGIVLGTGITMLRMGGNRILSNLAAGYVNIMRSLPLILVIFWFYFLVPYVGQWLTGAARPIHVGAFTSALLTFSLFEAAFFAEIVRAGIGAISSGQRNAALALGLTPTQTMLTVILPQVFRNMLPVMLNQTIVLFLDTSLVYVISITDLFGAAAKVAERDGRLVEMYTFAAFIYFAIAFGASQLVRRLQARIAIIR